MRFWRRRSPGKHALGAAVTGIPSAVPRPAVVGSEPGPVQASISVQASVPVQVPVSLQVPVPVPPVPAAPRTAVATALLAPADTAVHAVPLPRRTAATVDPLPAHAEDLAQAAERSAVQAAERSALRATSPQAATPPTGCAPVSSALERALFGHLLREQVSERPSIVVAQPPSTAGAETSPLTLAFVPPPAAPVVAPPTPVVVPSVELGFRDGSTVGLDPSSPHGRSLLTLARALTTLD